MSIQYFSLFVTCRKQQGCGLNFRESWIVIGREWLFPGNLRARSQLFGQRSVNSKGQVGRNGSDKAEFFGFSRKNMTHPSNKSWASRKACPACLIHSV
jgi:hypothetical protein